MPQATAVSIADPHNVNNQANVINGLLQVGGSISTTSSPASITTTTATLVSSSAQEASHVLKASPGILISLAGYNAGADQFIQIFNSATVPADTAVPKYSQFVPANSNFTLDVPITGIPLTTGIAVSNSSTQPTKTIGGANCWFSAVVI